MTTILALDVSSASTGVCVFCEGEMVKSSLQTINPNSKKPYGERLQYFKKALEEILANYKPDKVIVEDIFRGRNIKTYKSLAMFRGVCFLTIFEAIGKDPICVMPTEARKLAGVPGITKEDGFDFAVKKYKLTEFDFENFNDITDAIVLALACCEIDNRGLSEKDLLPKKKKRKKRKKRSV